MRLIVFSIFFVFASSVFSQVVPYVQFPQKHYHKIVERMSIYGSNYYVVSWKGDTVLNGQKYLKAYDGDEYYGAIREDVLNKRLFFWDSNGEEFEITFPYDAKVGDTIQISTAMIKAFLPGNSYESEHYQNDSSPSVVITIDTISHGVVVRKRYRLQELEYETWPDVTFTEGIGIEDFMFLNGAMETTCFYEDSLRTYGIFQHPFCPPILTGEKELDKLGRIDVYPNPSSGLIRVISNNGTQFELRNLQGQLVKVIDVSENEVVDLSQVKSGVYFLMNQKNRMSSEILILSK